MEAGAHVNARMGDDRETALMFAVIYGLRDCVKFLIQSVANVNLKDKVENTALICAAIHDEEKCIDLLINTGADVNVVVENGNTALIIAASEGNSSFVKELLQAGADVNAINTLGETALIEAVRCTDETCLRELISAGADVNKTDSRGKTALYWAVLSCAEECVRTLLKSGANVTQDSLLIHTAIRAKCSRRSMVLMLFAAGEVLDRQTVPIPEYLTCDHLELCLKHTCRETIRNHLVNLDLQGNLFVWVNQLGLPRPLAAYLLYNV